MFLFGVVSVVSVVGCYVVYKMLNRENSFEEAFPNEAKKLCRQNTKKTKPKKKGRTKRKHSPNPNNTEEQANEESEPETPNQVADELARLKSENVQLQKEKREQNERLEVFEQTMRNKLVENIQLQEANKKLADSLKQVNVKLSQVDEIDQKRHAMQAKRQKAQEEIVVPLEFATPNQWILQADIELGQGHFEQASEKYYRAGRLALDQCAKKCNIVLHTHNAANSLAYFISRQRPHMAKNWSLINGLHKNFYENTLSHHMIVAHADGAKQFIAFTETAHLDEAAKADYLKEYFDNSAIRIKKTTRVDGVEIDHLF